MCCQGRVVSWLVSACSPARVVAGLALWVPVMIAWCPQQLPSGNLGGWERFITYRSWKLHSIPEAAQGGHMGREGEKGKEGKDGKRRVGRGGEGRERNMIWGPALIGVHGGGLGFQGLTLYWWI